MTILRPGLTLYFIRHGETDWNREARYQGQRDIPMNDTGRAQARRNGRTLSTLSNKIQNADFVSSPLSRAVETMQIVRDELGFERDAFRRDLCLRELHYGHWEGLLASGLAHIDPEGLRQKSLDPFGWRPNGGESYRDLQDRVTDWLVTLDRDTVAVSHGGVSRVARAAVLGIAPGDVPFLAVPQDQIMLLSNDRLSWV